MGNLILSLFCRHVWRGARTRHDGATPIRQGRRDRVPSAAATIYTEVCDRCGKRRSWVEMAGHRWRVSNAYLRKLHTRGWSGFSAVPRVAQRESE